MNFETFSPNGLEVAASEVKLGFVEWFGANATTDCNAKRVASTAEKIERMV